MVHSTRGAADSAPCSGQRKEAAWWLILKAESCKAKISEEIQRGLAGRAPTTRPTGKDGAVTPPFPCPVDPAQSLSDSHQQFLSQGSVFLATPGTFSGKQRGDGRHGAGVQSQESTGFQGFCLGIELGACPTSERARTNLRLCREWGCL